MLLAFNHILSLYFPQKYITYLLTLLLGHDFTTETYEYLIQIGAACEPRSQELDKNISNNDIPTE